MLILEIPPTFFSLLEIQTEGGEIDRNNTSLLKPIKTRWN
jgi:hypothetical protein